MYIISLSLTSTLGMTCSNWTHKAPAFVGESRPTVATGTCETCGRSWQCNSGHLVCVCVCVCVFTVSVHRLSWYVPTHCKWLFHRTPKLDNQSPMFSATLIHSLSVLWHGTASRPTLGPYRPPTNGTYPTISHITKLRNKIVIHGRRDTLGSCWWTWVFEFPDLRLSSCFCCIAFYFRKRCWWDTLSRNK